MLILYLSDLVVLIKEIKMDMTKWTREQLEKVIKSKEDFIMLFGVEGYSYLVNQFMLPTKS